MKIMLSIILALATINLTAQSGTWTWMKGASALNGPAVEGQLGIPAVANTPQATYEPCNWTDLNGNFWVFGGSSRTLPLTIAGVLWKFDPLTNMWTRIKGTGNNNPSVYGIQGIPSPNNMPGARGYGAATWIDASGDLWLFGGSGFDANGVEGSLNDLWRYHIATNEWTWMSGSQNLNNAGNPGTLLVESAQNYPCAKEETRATWVDNSNNLWLYGGKTGGSQCELASSDMWRFNIGTNMWTRMKGTGIYNCNTTNLPAYGTLQVEDTSNTPGGRWVYCAYKEFGTPYFWLFGGKRRAYPGLCYEDVWRYNTTNNKWAWMAGTQINDSTGYYSQYCQPGQSYPASRFENSATWADSCGHFWNYGGLNKNQSSFSDMWLFNTNTLTFTWLTGADTTSRPGNYGILQTPAPTNYPAASSGSVGFTDKQGNMWMFGGLIVGQQNYGGYTNALWRYTPNDSCGGTFVNTLNIQPYFTPAVVNQCVPYPVNFNANYTNANATYHWDFGDTGITDTSNIANPTYTYTQPGTYIAMLSITLQGPCTTINSSPITITVPNQLTVANFPDTIVCQASSIDIGYPSPYTSLWNTGDTTDVITVTLEGVYWVELTNGGCIAYDTINVVKVGCTGIAESNSLQYVLKVIPNPAVNNAIILLNQTPIHPYTIEVFSADGRMLASATTQDKQYTLNLANYSNGLYFVRININGKLLSQKLCVVK